MNAADALAAKGAVGLIVYSTAGRDKKRPFLVVTVIDDRTVGVADGKLRSVSKPKPKNIRHVRFADLSIRFDGAFDDAAIREFLSSYEAGQG